MTVSKIQRLAPWLTVLVSALALPAQAQNIDAGKSPAQIFSDTCTGCHKSARELRRSSATFLRSHYMTGTQEANAMAGYLAGLPPDARANANQRRTGAAPAQAAPQPAAEPRQLPPRAVPPDQAKGSPSQPASKAGRRQPPPPSPQAAEPHPVTAAAAAVPEERSPEVAAVPVAPAAAPMAMPAAPPPMPAVSAAPVVAPAGAKARLLLLEPFEE